MKREKYLRTRYIRELERFVNRIVDFLQKEHSKEELIAHIHTIFRPLEEIEKVYLSSEYTKELERFAERNANLHLSDKSGEEIREDILKEANLLRKLKRKKSFRKAKHKKQFLED